MIQSFRCKDTEGVFQGRFSRRLPHDIQRQALKKLGKLHLAQRIEDLLLPTGNRLEQLSGDRKGQWSIRINDQWRICFIWQDGAAHAVEIVDYH